MPAPPPFPYPTGAIESPPDSRDYPARMRLGNAMAAAPLPSADRLKWMPPVITQTMGSCVAMSQAQVAAIHERGESGGTAVLNDESWYPELWAEQNPGVPFQDTGLFSRPALDSWRLKGPPIPVGRREHYSIEAYFSVSGWDEIRRIITEQRQPVLLVSKISTAWGETKANGQLLPYDYYGPNLPDPWIGLHQWTAWGYDLRPTLGMLIRSTWGPTYGMHGNVYMARRDFEASFVEAWWARSKDIR